MNEVVDIATTKMAEVTKSMGSDGVKAQQFSQAFQNMAKGQETLVDVELKRVQLESHKLDLELKQLELQKVKATTESPAKKT